MKPQTKPATLDRNHTSHFDCVEKSADLPISDVIADLLLARTPR